MTQNIIPKIIHQIWVGSFKIPHRENRLQQEIKKLHSDYTHHLWTDSNFNWSELPHNVLLAYQSFYEQKQFAFCADIIRLWVVYRYGGIYLDVDYAIRKKMDYFLQFEGVFCCNSETDFTIPNGFFASKKHCPVLQFCLNSIIKDSAWFGPSWMGRTIKQYFKLDYETPQNILLNCMKEYNINYYNSNNFYEEYAEHFSLASWFPENRERFLKGEQL